MNLSIKNLIRSKSMLFGALLGITTVTITATLVAGITAPERLDRSSQQASIDLTIIVYGDNELASRIEDALNEMLETQPIQDIEITTAEIKIVDDKVAQSSQPVVIDI